MKCPLESHMNSKRFQVLGLWVSRCLWPQPHISAQPPSSNQVSMMVSMLCSTLLVSIKETVGQATAMWCELCRKKMMVFG